MYIYIEIYIHIYALYTHVDVDLFKWSEERSVFWLCEIGECVFDRSGKVRLFQTFSTPCC